MVTCADPRLTNLGRMLKVADVINDTHCEDMQVRRQ
jgi:hypothetical protein